MPGLRPISEADQEWTAWKKELEHRHKLTQDQKDYAEWVRAGSKPSPYLVQQKHKTLQKYPVVIRPVDRFAF